MQAGLRALLLYGIKMGNMGLAAATPLPPSQPPAALHPTKLCRHPDIRRFPCTCLVNSFLPLYPPSPRPGIVGMRGSMVIRLRPCAIAGCCYFCYVMSAKESHSPLPTSRSFPSPPPPTGKRIDGFEAAMRYEINYAHKVRKAALQAVLSRVQLTLHVPRRTPRGASSLVRAIST